MLLLVDVECVADTCAVLVEEALERTMATGASKAVAPESERVGDNDWVTRQFEEDECFLLCVAPEKLETREGCWKGGSGEAQREETVSGV